MVHEMKWVYVTFMVSRVSGDYKYASIYTWLENWMLCNPQVQSTNKGQAEFSLSRSVLSIIHEMCLLFFLDPAQHNTSPTAWLPSPAYKFASPMREQWVFPTAQLHQWSHMESVTAISHLNFTNTTAPGPKAANVFISHLLRCVPGYGEKWLSRSYRLQIVRLLLCFLDAFPYW